MVTTIEDGLKRLLRLCPTIILDPISIQLIIDGKTNQVIAEHNGVFDEPPVLNENITTSDNDVQEVRFYVSKDSVPTEPIKVSKKTHTKKKKSIKSTTKKIAKDVLGEMKKDKKSFGEYFD